MCKIFSHGSDLEMSEDDPGKTRWSFRNRSHSRLSCMQSETNRVQLRNDTRSTESISSFTRSVSTYRDTASSLISVDNEIQKSVVAAVLKLDVSFSVSSIPILTSLLETAKSCLNFTLFHPYLSHPFKCYRQCCAIITILQLSRFC